MDDALLVRRFESRRNLLRNRQRLIERHAGLPRRSARGAEAGDGLREILAFDQLHDERMDGRLPCGCRWGLLEAVDDGDVWVIQGREGPRFALEARQALRILREGLGQHLDRHFPPQTRIGSAIHLAHSAGAERRDNFIRSEACAWRQRHGVGGLYGK